MLENFWISLKDFYIAADNSTIFGTVLGILFVFIFVAAIRRKGKLK